MQHVDGPRAEIDDRMSIGLPAWAALARPPTRSPAAFLGHRLGGGHVGGEQASRPAVARAQALARCSTWDRVAGSQQGRARQRHLAHGAIGHDPFRVINVRAKKSPSCDGSYSSAADSNCTRSVGAHACSCSAWERTSGEGKLQLPQILDAA